MILGRVAVSLLVVFAYLDVASALRAEAAQDPPCPIISASKAAASGFESGRSAQVIFSMLPQRAGKVAVIGTPSQSVEALIRHVGSEQIKHVPLHAINTEHGDRFDLIVDSSPNDDLPSRVHALFPRLNHQGLYIAERVQSHSDSMRCWWTRVVSMLIQPSLVGSTVRYTGECAGEQYDLPLESAHAWNGVIALRKGLIHPLWDQNQSAWLVDRSAIRYTDALPPSENKRLLAMEQRDDGCWHGRSEFLKYCATHSADKGYFHAYWRAYGALLQSVRNTEGFRLAEMGLAGGNSARVWFDFFRDDAQFFEYDLNTSTFRGVSQSMSNEFGSRFHAIGSSLDPDDPPGNWRNQDFDVNGTTMTIEAVKRDARQNGGFDVIIDDAAHSPLENTAFFHELIGNVRSGGYYICEDLAAGGVLPVSPLTLNKVSGSHLAGIQQTTPVDVFVNVTEYILSGDIAGLVSAHWWHETVMFERG